MKISIYAGLLSLILLSSLLSNGLKELSTPPPALLTPRPEITTQKATRFQGLVKKQAQLSDGYEFSKLDRILRTERSQFALCLLKNKDFYSPRIKMVLFWEGSGSLKKIHLVPDAGEQVRDCLKERVQHWDLQPHPGMQPFSYEVTLIPS